MFTAIKSLINPVLVSLTLVAYVCIFFGRFEEGYFVLLALSFLLVSQIFDDIDIQSNNKVFWRKTVLNILTQWLLIISILLLTAFASKVTDYFSRQVIILWILSVPVILVLAQLLIRRGVMCRSIKEGMAAKAVIIGVNDLSLKLMHTFKQNPMLLINCMGFFDDRQRQRLFENSQQDDNILLGNLASVAKFINSHKIQQVYISLPMSDEPRTLKLLDDLRDTTASIYFLPDIFLVDLIQANISTIQGIPIVTVCESPFVGINGSIKRFSDIILSLFILLLIAPLMAFIAMGVALGSPGPVLFKQRRYGLDGKEITVYKFRSMTVIEDDDQVIQATKKDPRITRFGSFLRKTSLDELPQFINVLQGHMSIVGPRPHAVSHNELYRSLIKGYMIRHKVKPGITGWAQVKGFRGETDTIEKMQSRIDFDLDYLRNWSIFLDLWIILRTVSVVISDKNAY
jgi:putative colanic acid biosynthesis UDP-glucose lipid carrier transferase